MSSEINVRLEIKDLIDEIILKNDFGPTVEVTYNPGSQVGDGYGSKTYAVNIKNHKKSLQLFLKSVLNLKDASKFQLNKLFANETLFYKTIYPQYSQFLEEKGIKDGFNNVPKYYGACEKRASEVIALGNIRHEGYTLFDTLRCMNDRELTLMLQTFAKFHAVSFAIKDQKRDLQEEWCKNIHDLTSIIKGLKIDKMYAKAITNFIVKMDPVTDKFLLDRLNGVDEKIADCVMDITSLPEYTILTKGDCWINNAMLLYENEDKENLLDIMLIDWQLIRMASPVHDIGPVFYTLASKEALDNLKHYLLVYHNELSKRIRELGSNPEILYPYSAFETDWKTIGLYSFGMSAMILRAMLCDKSQAPSFEELINTEQLDNTDGDLWKPKDEDEFLKRMKNIATNLIEIGAL